jgi:hypothetical protein
VLNKWFFFIQQAKTSRYRDDGFRRGGGKTKRTRQSGVGSDDEEREKERERIAAWKTVADKRE